MTWPRALTIFTGIFLLLEVAGYRHERQVAIVEMSLFGWGCSMAFDRFVRWIVGL